MHRSTQTDRTLIGDGLTLLTIFITAPPVVLTQEGVFSRKLSDFWVAEAGLTYMLSHGSTIHQLAVRLGDSSRLSKD